MDPELQKILKRQRYAIIGKHSGVKLCHWMKQSLLFNRTCYKQTFYGIQSHRCLQMTPSISHCTHMCLFCWRFQEFTEKTLQDIDEPEYILNQAIAAQQKLLTGFKGDPRCDQKKWKEANEPDMLACSLSGEPTLYPKLGEFFEACHQRGITTFLVTNGTNPEALERLNPLPRQLYVSLVAPTEELYKKLCAPLILNGWEKIQRTLQLLPSLDTRTVIRHTLVQGWNMDDNDIAAYAKLDAIASPTFVEPKGYVFVGSSRNRLHFSNMPTHDQIKHFGQSLADHLSYDLLMEKPDSFVVLLGQQKHNTKIK
jgi:tRNA wybutosine-synthesizing protein 1